MKILPSICLLLPLLVLTFPAVAKQPAEHPSVKAARTCLLQVDQIVRERKVEGPDISCEIPIVLSEHDLDELFKAAVRTASSNEKWQAYLEKYSPAIAKTLTNFRAAECKLIIREKRAHIIDALNAANSKLELPDQLVDCQVTTQKYQRVPLHFAFSPVVDFSAGCVDQFALNMGKIDANCRVCYFNRLYIATTLVSVWANSLAGNVTRELNHLLGDRCQR